MNKLKLSISIIETSYLPLKKLKLKLELCLTRKN